MMSLGIIIGSTIGSLIPYLWGADILSIWGLVFSTLGAIVGIIVVYKLKNYY